jgi:hypothetical protein
MPGSRQVTRLNKVARTPPNRAEAGAGFIDALKLVVRLVNIGDAKTLACLKWTPCPGQYCPEFKRVRLLPLQRFGAAPS